MNKMRLCTLFKLLVIRKYEYINCSLTEIKQDKSKITKRVITNDLINNPQELQEIFQKFTEITLHDTRHSRLGNT